MISRIFKVNSIYEDDKDILLFWQKRIFNYLLLTLLILGIIPYILICKYAVHTSDWHWVLFYTLIYFWVGGVRFLTKAPFQIRVWAGISVFYFMGFFSMLVAGLTGSARLFFLCFSIFAAIFSGIKGGLVTLVVNIMTLTLFGIVHHNGLLSSIPTQGVPSPDKWIVFTASFSFLCAAVTFSLAILIKALEISGKEFKHLVKNTPNIIWTLDQNFDITFISSAVYPTFGFIQKELMGKPITRFLNEKKIETFKNRVKRADDFNYETTIHHKDGRPIHVEVNGSKINNFSDSSNMYQGMIRDISQKKLQEGEQQRLKEKLRRAEKLKALGLLTGSVAHDLNNILLGIATYPEVLMMNKTLDPRTIQGLRLIKDSGQKASAVVSDLLTISRGVGVEMEVININSIIERYTAARDFYKIRETYQQVKIGIETDPELLNTRGSYIHIEKTIMNLFLNAMEEVAEKQDGKVFITTTNLNIDTAMPGYKDRIPGEYVMLSVIDNGSGIDESNIKKIFDPFFTRKKMGKSGTGLGLTVVWNTVQDHNGFINVISNSEETRFELLFPAVREEIQQKETTSLDEIKGQGQRILVVDDLKDQQKIALTILENLGYQATSVDNGYAAVEFIKKNPTDLVILDMIMSPSISGLETYQMIKKTHPGQKAIIASGYSESEDVLTAQDLGAGSFVKKPYSILDMGIAIKQELER